MTCASWSRFVRAEISRNFFAKSTFLIVYLLICVVCQSKYVFLHEFQIRMVFEDCYCVKKKEKNFGFLCKNVKFEDKILFEMAISCLVLTIRNNDVESDFKTSRR
jgi:hypothetical protein